MKHAKYQFGYVDSLFELIMPKYDDNGEYISTGQRLNKLKNIQAERRINHCVEKLRNVAIRKHY